MPASSSSWADERIAGLVRRKDDAWVSPSRLLARPAKTMIEVVSAPVGDEVFYPFLRNAAAHLAPSVIRLGVGSSSSLGGP